MLQRRRIASTTKLMLVLTLTGLQTDCSTQTPGGAPSPGARGSPDSVRAALLRLARDQYTYGDPRAPLGGTNPALPELSIATATERGRPSTPRSERIVARLHSSRAYPRMGIPAGVSYIWRDTAGGLPNRRMLIVPESLSSPMMWLRVQMTPKLPTDPVEPVLVANGVAFLLQGCVPDCEGEHCTTRDSLGSFSDRDAGAFRQFISRSSIGRFVRW
jgi:hypothetical protein